MRAINYTSIWNKIYSLKYIVSGIFTYVQVTITILRSQYGLYTSSPITYLITLPITVTYEYCISFIYNKGGLWETCIWSFRWPDTFLIYIWSSPTVSGSQLLKPLEFPKWEEQNMWFHVLSSWKLFRKDDDWVGAVCQKNQPSWSFQSHPLISRKGKGAKGWISCQWPMI